ncbi:MAG TPA: tetratricopeptide repeat protein [Mucilaginibacter sp.]
MNKKQIVIIIATVAITGYLYSLPVKGLVKPKATRTNAGVANDQQPANTVTVATVSATAKTAIGAGLSAKITDLEGQLSKASESDKLAIEKQLATNWDDVNQPAPAAFYYLTVARKDNKFEDWLNAGNRFNDAYKLTQDTVAQPLYTANAVEAFQNATKLKPESLDAKTGLGIAYVNGGGAPMQGIALLLGVVKQDPNNRAANLNLGLFSMKSGQYEKAIDRFKTVIAQKPEFESYFYLAETYKQLGRKPEAIAAYQKCKEMMPDPVFGQRIDEYIKELKN